MQLPVKAHYATLAMLALAEQYASEQQIPARVIAREQRIPSQFLGQILQQLRATGLLGSTRGSNGGFRLAKRPSEITLAEVVDAVCPWSAGFPMVESNGTALTQAVNSVWSELNVQQRELLERVSLGDLLLRVEHSPATMFYI